MAPHFDGSHRGMKFLLDECQRRGGSSQHGSLKQGTDVHENSRRPGGSPLWGDGYHANLLGFAQLAPHVNAILEDELCARRPHL